MKSICKDNFDISAFVRAIEECCTLEAFDHHLAGLAIRLGFNWYTLQDIALLSDESLRAIRLTNYPEKFWERYDHSGYLQHDPILKALDRTGRVLCWREIPGIVSLTKKQTNVLLEATRAGIVDGVSVAVRVPGLHHGLLTIISNETVDITDNQKAVLSYVAPIAYETAARLHARRPLYETSADVDPSPRQLECLVLVARGKSDWEAAQILGLSEQTVHRHVEILRNKLGVRRRTQLVVKALHCGLISYRDVL